MAKKISYIKARKSWRTRFTHDGKSIILDISIKQMINGWAKTIGNVELSFHRAIKDRTKEGSRAAANEWAAYVQSKLTLDDLDVVPALHQHIEQLEAETKHAPEHAEQNNAEVEEIKKEIELQQIAKQRDIDIQSSRNEIELFTTDLPAELERRLLLSPAKHELIPDELLVGFWHNRYLDVERKNKRAASTWDNFKRDTKTFIEWIGENTSIKTINETTIEDYWIYLQQFGTSKQKACIKKCRAFVRYLYKHRMIDLPRNLTDHTVTEDELDILHFSIDEMKHLLNTSDGFLKCCLHLMANCGFYQGDVATLEPSMYANGYITRHRDKLKKKGKIISWKLWPQTIELIEQHKVDGQFMFLRDDGSKWAEKITNEDDSFTKTDHIYKDLWLPFAKAAKPSLPMKHFRKSAAQHLPYADFSIQYDFLCKAPTGDAAKHYVKPTKKKFDRSVTALGKLLFG